MQILERIQEFEVEPVEFSSKVQAVLIGISIWSLLLLILQTQSESVFMKSKQYQVMNRTQQIQAKGYLYSAIHSTYASFVGLYFLFYSCSNPAHSYLFSEECRESGKNVTVLLMYLALGYFVNDLILINGWYEKTQLNQQYAWHHYLVIVGLLITAGNGGYIMMANGTAFCVEISTIFSNLICLMEQLKWDQSKAYLSFGIFMAITFFIFRIIFPAFLNYIIWQQLMVQQVSLPVIFITVSFTLFYLLNWYWFYLIIQEIRKKINEIFSNNKKLKNN